MHVKRLMNEAEKLLDDNGKLNLKFSNGCLSHLESGHGFKMRLVYSKAFIIDSLGLEEVQTSIKAKGRGRLHEICGMPMNSDFYTANYLVIHNLRDNLLGTSSISRVYLCSPIAVWMEQKSYRWYSLETHNVRGLFGGKYRYQLGLSNHRIKTHK